MAHESGVVQMNRIRTQEDFVKRAVEIHGDKYDYSKTVYVKSNEPVTIICPIHGEFLQTPNKHLAGQGCKLCGRARTRVGYDEFVKRAKAVHGDKYDYSKVQYVRKDVKVCIVCPIHGEFMQTPASHIVQKQGCPKCGHMLAGQKRCGDNNVMRRADVKEKAQQTCLDKYGAKTYAESEEGRCKLREIITSPVVSLRMQETCMSRYGAKTWPQSVIGHERLHEIMSSEDMQAKIKAGYLDAYGVDHFMKTESGRIIARENLSSPERRLAIRESFLRRYGVENAFLIPSVQAQRDEMLAKGWATKRRNGTFNTSRPEESLYRLLCDKFGCENVVRQYFDVDRYPFYCDFYIPMLDLFIELNASWTHGQHWFDENNPLDVSVLNEWKTRAKQRGSRYYKLAIDVWTRRDLEKLRYALTNHLNYLVFWDNNLTDAISWLDSL